MGDRVERLVLVGLSGSGKSTVGRQVAQQLGWAFADSDDWIVGQTGRTIPDLFANEGETRFRQIEHQALRALCQRSRLVLATGGGVITVAANWPLLRAASRVIWLQVEPETVVARLAAQRDEGVQAVRPLLAGGEPLQRVRAMAAARAALYAQADLSVAVNDYSPARAAAAVLAAVQASGAQLALAAHLSEEGTQ